MYSHLLDRMDLYELRSGVLGHQSVWRGFRELAYALVQVFWDRQGERHLNPPKKSHFRCSVCFCTTALAYFSKGLAVLGGVVCVL